MSDSDEKGTNNICKKKKKELYGSSFTEHTRWTINLLLLIRALILHYFFIIIDFYIKIFHWEGHSHWREDRQFKASHPLEKQNRLWGICAHF